METLLEKISLLKAQFASCKSKEEIYGKIMELGKQLKALGPEDKIPSNLVSGCQSIMYLKSSFQNGKMFFEADSNALISAGLAFLLIFVYSGQSPETILLKPPQFLNEMGIYSSLSLNRANGLMNIFLKMKQEAVKSLSKANNLV
ncbi:MAG TPA: SufE family protein [Chlamydiales bacterium]|nr:SufE family protein [Chlamydiales bacterium]